MPNYGDPKYWDKRYEENDGSTFDWLEDYTSLKPLLKDYITPESKILMIGCGNACLSEDLYDDGFPYVHNIDISTVVIDQMKKRNETRPKMIYEVMDCTQMDLADNSFDIAIDKSTIDALLCGDNAYINVAKMMNEIIRVLKPNGLYMSITYGTPENRDEHFERAHLSWKMRQFVLYPASC